MSFQDHINAITSQLHGDSNRHHHTCHDCRIEFQCFMPTCSSVAWCAECLKSDGGGVVEYAGYDAELNCAGRYVAWFEVKEL